MSTRAKVEWDPRLRGVRLAVGRDGGYLTWGQTGCQPYDPEGAQHGPEGWLTLDEDDARAIYEALADWFGHSGHDTRSLRKDYDAERRRVDNLIAHLTR